MVYISNGERRGRASPRRRGAGGRAAEDLLRHGTALGVGLMGKKKGETLHGEGEMALIGPALCAAQTQCPCGSDSPAVPVCCP